MSIAGGIWLHLKTLDNRNRGLKIKLNKMFPPKRIGLFFEKAKWINHFVPFNLGSQESYVGEEGWDKMTGVANLDKGRSLQGPANTYLDY